MAADSGRSAFRQGAESEEREAEKEGPDEVAVVDTEHAEKTSSTLVVAKVGVGNVATSSEGRFMEEERHGSVGRVEKEGVEGEMEEEAVGEREQSAEREEGEEEDSRGEQRVLALGCSP